MRPSSQGPSKNLPRSAPLIAALLVLLLCAGCLGPGAGSRAPGQGAADDRSGTTAGDAAADRPEAIAGSAAEGSRAQEPTALPSATPSPPTGATGTPGPAENADAPGEGWRTLEPGLDLGSFRLPQTSSAGDSTVRIVRVDPQRWALRLLNASAPGQGHNLTARGWARREGLAAAINTSMYQTDFKTSVGLMQTPGHINNPHLSKENTILAFDRLDDGAPPVKLIDRQCDDFDAWRGRYGTLVQSIRMLTCHGENAWSQQPRKWSTAAIGTDREGRVLLMHVRSPYSVHDFIENLRRLPLGLDRAMYVEGGPEAQLYVQGGGEEHEFVGSFETGFNESDLNDHAWAVPNVIGVAARSGGPSGSDLTRPSGDTPDPAARPPAEPATPTPQGATAAQLPVLRTAALFPQETESPPSEAAEIILYDDAEYGPDDPLDERIAAMGIAVNGDSTIPRAKLVVEKRKYRLALFADGRLVKRYRIQLGRDPVGRKEMIGDFRTPEGDYFVCQKGPSRYYQRLYLSYPNAEDAGRALHSGLIDAGTFDRIRRASQRGVCPPRNTSLGGDILIHGQHPDRTKAVMAEQLERGVALRRGLEPGDVDPRTLSTAFNWTLGCVALTNPDIRELVRYVALGTPVHIE